VESLHKDHHTLEAWNRWHMQATDTLLIGTFAPWVTTSPMASWCATSLYATKDHAKSNPHNPIQAGTHAHAKARRGSVRVTRRKTKKGVMLPSLSYRHLGHKNGVTLSQTPWVDPWVGLRGYGIRVIRPTVVTVLVFLNVTTKYEVWIHPQQWH
jgi:hypothetical protein